ncbi:hypothetical protein K3495_g4864 [Podosphaera aphanis]|nr:hypothetical protein K3495_g4864 [Podosphaera aphanis]
MSSKNTNEIDRNTINPKASSTHPTILIGKISGRQSTPDSEALISSDDETDRLEQSQPAPYTESQVRRASWLNDSSPILTQPRKASFASSSMSPTTSQPSTPSADPGIWGNQYSSNSAFTRGHTGSSTFPWGNGIWNNDARKEPPSRLSEVLPSPTALASPLSPNNGFHGESGSINRDQSTNSQIPFAIPLHPTPKTYRSQSYSVGQLDLDSPVPAISYSTIIPSSRGRQIQHSGLLHRPSRPSMLSEISNESFLCNVEEVEDYDDKGINSSSQGTIRSNEAKTIEKLTRENARLRQQYKDSYPRPQSSTSNLPNYGLPETHLERSDSAIDEFEESNEFQRDIPRKSIPRKFNEYRGEKSSQIPPCKLIQNRKVENVKKGFWQSSLGFGGLEDIPQSRRHSFATIPTRNNLTNSSGEPLMTHDTAFQESITSTEFSKNCQDQISHSLNEHITAYFGGILSFSHNSDIYNTARQQQPTYPFTPKNSFSGTRAISPPRSMHGASQIRINQPLHIVLFKCSRSDIFFIQEGTGLSVKPGDLVIVEADRGTDLGTVACANIDWATAKELKEYYSEEHYKWLMMYSKGASRALDGTGAGLMAASNNIQRGTVGGMGPPYPHGTQEPNSSDTKPKIIKRLAQKHEIQALREKEGNEAKAKRVCIQKVKEHGLHMEILDAEFQMDWKKLTFYYFADAYINFNSLVTDLFKAYKTRIWMSAINPASFANPLVGLSSSSGVSPGVVYGICPMRTQAPEKQHQKQSAHTAGRGYQIPYTQQFSHSLDRPLASYLPPSAPPYNIKFLPFGTMQETNSGFSPIEPFANSSAPSDFQEHPSHFSSLHGPILSYKDFNYRREPTYSPSKDTWINSFQGLSMNSR